jgi:cobalt-zinc-cadmium efflux system protein
MSTEQPVTVHSTYVDAVSDDHQRPGSMPERNLFIIMLLNFLITIVEVVGGIYSGSLSLLSDAMHNFSDGVAIIVSYGAIQLSKRPRTLKYTFGLKRVEILAAIINASTLFIISFFLIKEAVGRFSNPMPITGSLMLAVAAVSLVANLAGTLLLKRGSAGNLNIRGAYLHLATDAISSAAVIVGAACIMAFNIGWIDPALTILIALYILRETYAIVKESVDVIMMSSPPAIDMNDLQQVIEGIPGVRNVHHVHVWRLNDTDIHFEAHIEVDDISISQTAAMQQQIDKTLREAKGITHTTLQFECGVCGTKGLLG